MKKKKLKKKIEKLTKKNKLLQLQMILLKTNNNSLQSIIISEDEKEFSDKYLASKMAQRSPVDKPLNFCAICDYNKTKQEKAQRNKGYDF